MLSVLISCLTLLAFDAILFVHAGIYVLNPQQGSACHGGKPCTIDWLDDGQSPLLSAVGRTTVGLYFGHQRLVQAIGVVDVSSDHSLTFTPKPSVGPNSGKYYLSFVSVDLKNGSIPYSAFSPFFKLDKMIGSFASPDPSAVSSFSIPRSTPTTNDVLSTVTVGTLSTSTSSSRVRSTPFNSQATPSPTPISTLKDVPLSSSGFTTSVLPTSSPSPSSPPTNANTSGGARSIGGIGFCTTLVVAVGLTLVL